MKKTLINQALKNAVGQESCGNTSVQAEKTDPAALSWPTAFFRAWLMSVFFILYPFTAAAAVRAL